MPYHTNRSHEVPLSFVWLKFSSFGWDDDGGRNKECQKPKLGMPEASQDNIQEYSSV